MSKLYNNYLALKKQDEQTIYLFKSGVFFIALDNDARTLSNTFNFKLGKLTDEIVKCGFPCASFYKYYTLFEEHNLKIKIIETETNTLFSINEYKQNCKITELLNLINSVDINTLSISKAYELIEKLKSRADEINNINIG